jgi:hypothetical protein
MWIFKIRKVEVVIYRRENTNERWRSVPKIEIMDFPPYVTANQITNHHCILLPSRSLQHIFFPLSFS